MSKRINEELVLVFLCYKQEKYLRETLRSALEQSVYPSVLLILDDASPDESESVIREILDTADPSLNVQYCRNEANVGLMAQLNSLRNRFQNKLIVLQAGDDVSKPNRLERIYAEWLSKGKPSLVLSNFDEIDDNGTVVKRFDAVTVKSQKAYSFKRLINRRAAVFGCSAAFNSNMLNAFPEIPKNVVNEDRIYSFRALLKNGVHYIHEPLLLYRVGVGISARTEESYLDYLTREAQRELSDLKVNRQDAQQESRSDLIKLVDRRIKTVSWIAELSKVPTITNSWRVVFSGVPVMDFLKFIKRIKKRA